VSQELLKQPLKVSGIKMLSTCEDIPSGKVFWPNLTVIKLSPVLEVAEYAPKLHEAQTKRFVAVSEWWLKEIAYIVNGYVITRKDLVLKAANTDGGAHVADKFNPHYENLLNGAGWKMTLNPPTGASKELAFKYGHLAALRQIAYETFNSPSITSLAL
jgi:hypothetical protein